MFASALKRLALQFSACVILVVFSGGCGGDRNQEGLPPKVYSFRSNRSELQLEGGGVLLMATGGSSGGAGAPWPVEILISNSTAKPTGLRVIEIASKAETMSTNIPFSEVENGHANYELRLRPLSENQSLLLFERPIDFFSKEGHYKLKFEITMDSGRSYQVANIGFALGHREGTSVGGLTLGTKFEVSEE